MKRAIVVLLTAAALFAQGQKAAAPPDLTGVWSPAGGGGGGRGAAAPAIALKEPYKSRYEEMQKKIQAASQRGEQYATKGLCSPYGMPNMMQVAIYPMEIIQRADQVTIIGEAFSETRRIYIGKKQVPVDDVAPGYWGRSVGHWEGDTLVVDTVGVRDDIVAYQNIPHSDRIHFTERITRPTETTLQDQITIEDPLALEKPVTYTLSYRLVPDYEMVEFVCDNNREYIDENGIVKMRLGGK